MTLTFAVLVISVVLGCTEATVLSTTFLSEKMMKSSAIHACVRLAIQNKTGRSEKSVDALLALPQSSGYNYTLELGNDRLTWIRPSIVVLPQHEDDVAAALYAAQMCKLPFSVVSGGHSAVGYCLKNEGLTLNLRSMKGATFGETADGQPIVTINAGTRFRHVYDELLKYKNGTYVITGGGCPGVAPGGFISGGGWSFLTRMYGMAIDNVLQIRIVLANQSIWNVSANEHPDLWWALRGGGGGNFGVVTQFVMKLHKPPQDSTVGVLCWRRNDPSIPGMFHDWIANFSHQPKWINLDPVWLPHNSSGHNLNFCWQIFCFNTPSLCNDWVATFRARNPPLDQVKVQPYLPWQAALGNHTSAGVDGSLSIKSFVIKQKDFTAETVKVLTEAIRISPNEQNLILFHIGHGAVQEVAENATAFAFRDLMCIIQIKAIWDDIAFRDVNLAWMDLVARALRPFVSGAYVNYMDSTLHDWPRMYYGQHYERLITIKKAIDPMNFFKFNQSIGSEWRP